MLLLGATEPIMECEANNFLIAWVGKRPRQGVNMRAFAIVFLCAGASMACAGSAFAADMRGDEIKTYLSDKTIYIQTTAASASGAAGQAIIYYSKDGNALYKTPGGAIWHGTWQTKQDTLCVDWKERPNNACVRYGKSGDVVQILEASSGQVRGTIVKNVAGNAESLKP